jgi:preprotein translocase subunit SecE
VAEKEKNDKVKEPNRLQRWWRETIGELRKVSWPTPQEAWRLTRIVLIVMAAMSAALGLLDFIFSKVIEAIIIAA